MQAISRIAAIAALAAHCAAAQPRAAAQDPAPAAQARPAQAGPVRPPMPIDLADPPAPPELAPLAPDFLAAMANSQLQTYRFSQLTEQALALKKLCDTGFGPADICPKAGAARAGGSGPAETGEMPSVAEITGTKGALSALLVLADGRHITVRTGAMLPGGLQVVSITEDTVRVSIGRGRETVLYFAGGTQ
jgi:type IV pilus biogenesis protein PilP